MSANLNFRIGIAEVHKGNRHARVTTGVSSLQGAFTGANDDAIALAPHPYRHALRRAVGHKSGQMSEVRTVKKLLDFVREDHVCLVFCLSKGSLDGEPAR